MLQTAKPEIPFEPSHIFSMSTKDVLFFQSNSVKHAYWLISGRVDMKEKTPQNKIKMRPIPPSSFIDIETVVSNQIDNAHTATAIIKSTDTRIARVPLPYLFEQKINTPQLVDAINTQHLQLTHSLRQKNNLAQTTVENRLITELISLKDTFGSTASIGNKTTTTIQGFTKTDFSEMIGCSREMVGRVLEGLENADLLQYQKGKRVYIPHVEALEERSTDAPYKFIP